MRFSQSAKFKNFKSKPSGKISDKFYTPYQEFEESKLTKTIYYF